MKMKLIALSMALSIMLAATIGVYAESVEPPVVGDTDTIIVYIDPPGNN